MESAPRDAAGFMEVAGRRLEYRWIGGHRLGPPIVFLHEGLGSVELWRDFPEAVVDRSGRPGFVYSRYGNGWSTPLSGPRPLDYMHTEAVVVLPEIVDDVLGRPPILVGHSDGASIALIYAGSGHPVEGLVLIAPHVFVEDETTGAISSIRDGFAVSGLAERMAKYHARPERTFFGWADAWLDPGFRDWNIETYVTGVRCPTLLIQGDGDEYGTVRQLDAIEARLEGSCERLLVEGAGHSPQSFAPELVAGAISEFVKRLA